MGPVIDALAGNSLCAELEYMSFYCNTSHADLTRLRELGLVSNLRELELWVEPGSPQVLEALVSSTVEKMTLDMATPEDDGALARFLLSGQTPNLRELSLGGCGLGEASSRALAATPHLKQLERLELSSEADISALMEARHLDSLCALDLCNTRASDATLTGLSRARFASNLDELLLGGSSHEFGIAGCQALGHSMGLEGLRRLDLSNNQLGDDGVAALFSGHGFASLQELTLANCGLTGASFELIARSPAMSSLRVLDLSGLTDAGLRGLGKRPCNPSPLHTLRLEGLHSGALGRLVRSGLAPGLIDVSLVQSDITEEDARALQRTSWFDGLFRARLHACQINDQVFRLLCDGGLTRCADLQLGDNLITSCGLAALSELDVSNIRTLCLSGNSIDDAGAHLLAALPFQQLRYLHSDCGFSPEAEAVLKSAPWFEQLCEWWPSLNTIVRITPIDRLF